ncbi:MAG: GNAT family N-acetyltransferase [Pseudomonadota bacterium]
MNNTRCIEKLRRDHRTEDFDCGRVELNRYLIRYAWPNQQAAAARTYVGLAGSQIVGFYTLVVGEVKQDQAPDRIIKGLAKHPVPIMLLARLAVDRRWQEYGVGKALLKDAMLRTLQAADIAGIRCIAVHAKNDQAKAFYQHFDFIPSPTDPLHLFILLKDVKRMMSG